MKKIWIWLKDKYQYLNGNKSWIGGVLLSIINLPPVAAALGVWHIPLAGLITALTGYSIYDKVYKKKSFTKNYK